MIVNENADDSYHMEETKKFLPNEQVKEKIKFSGLTKEEVMAYSTDPTWVRLRWIFFVLFWLVWLGLLGSAIAIVVVTPPCPYRPKMNWFENEIIYQVDVEKFRDSDGDGSGDLNGLIEKLDYFKSLGIETLCLKSNVIDPESPTMYMDKFVKNTSPKEFAKKLKNNDMHLILDIPYEYVQSDENVLSEWLSHHVDGVRVTQVPENVEQSELQKLIDLTTHIGNEQFETKFIAFYPYENNEADSLKPSLVFKHTFDQDFYKTEQKKQKFLTNIEKSYEDVSLWPAYMTSSSSDRLGEIIKNKKQLEMTHGLILLLKNTPVVSFGDELEFKNKNKFMKWDGSVNCGFSSNKSVSVGQSCENSVRDYTSHGAGMNLIRMYKELTKLRKEPSFSWGDLNINTKAENIISFTREAKGFDGYLVALNIANKKSGSTDFQLLHNIPKNATVRYFYSNNELSSNEFTRGLVVLTDRILLKPGELLIAKYDTNV